MGPNKYTQYVPIRFVVANTGGRVYLLQCRKNKRTGEVCFKNTRVNPLRALVYPIPDISFNAQENMDKILNEK